MLTAGQLFEAAQSIVGLAHCEILSCDRDALAVALFFHGYSAGQACRIAFVEIEDDDGVLQMLARHRTGYNQGERV